MQNGVLHILIQSTSRPEQPRNLRRWSSLGSKSATRQQAGLFPYDSLEAAKQQPSRCVFTNEPLLLLSSCTAQKLHSLMFCKAHLTPVAIPLSGCTGGGRGGMGASGARSRGEVLPNHQPTIAPNNGEMHSVQPGVAWEFSAPLRSRAPKVCVKFSNQRITF